MPCYTRTTVSVELNENILHSRLEKVLLDMAFSTREFEELKRFTKYNIQIELRKNGKIEIIGYDQSRIEEVKKEIMRKYSKATVIDNAKKFGFKFKEQENGKLLLYR